MVLPLLRRNFALFRIYLDSEGLALHTPRVVKSLAAAIVSILTGDEAMRLVLVKRTRANGRGD